jgi:hypothetical protein
MDETGTIIEIKEFPLIHIILRVLLIAWICFAVYNFDKNPVFFGFTIGLSAILFFTISERSITIDKSTLTVMNARWLPFLTTRKKYNIAEIEVIEYEKKEFILIAFILSTLSTFPSHGWKQGYLFIKMSDGTWEKIKAIGPRSKNEALLRQIAEIKSENRPK